MFVGGVVDGRLQGGHSQAGFSLLLRAAVFSFTEKTLKQSVAVNFV